ncbi:hypothetical protein LB506_002729 [Fusarium annulatum]|nr:hypothetical protein LB506_002729 [Fusarium annulatum]
MSVAPERLKRKVPKNLNGKGSVEVIDSTVSGRNPIAAKKTTDYNALSDAPSLIITTMHAALSSALRNPRTKFSTSYICASRVCVGVLSSSLHFWIGG